tara:strand:+ start:3574 stop:3834 length:261 start_codon:yes stop_codon:yes gene_type:complete
MKATTARAVSKLGWALGKALNLVGFIGSKVVREVTNRPKHDIQVINTYTGEVMHTANNISTIELNKILDAMRTLKGTVEVIVKTVK